MAKDDGLLYCGRLTSMSTVISQWRKATRDASLTPVVASFGLAIAWLLPNFAHPWLAFHRDAWAAAVLALVLLGTTLKDPMRWRCSATVLGLLAVACIPIFQWLSGLIDLFGDAFLSSCYLLGFCLAVWLGENWSRSKGPRPVDVVLSAAAIAALISVGLQLYQMAGLSTGEVLTDIWVLRFSPAQGRPYANMAQPNQLASLLLLGVAGFFWMAWRGWIGRRVLAGVVGVLVVGLALTQSRSAMVTTMLLAITSAILVHKKLVPAVVGRWAAALVIWYAIALLLVYAVSVALGVGDGFALGTRTRNETRWLIWTTFWEAALLEPWTGYGWRHTYEGLMRVFPSHPQFNDWYFEQAHNLFLDLVLWCGIPLGGLLSVAVLLWFRQQRFFARDHGRRIVQGAIVALVVHSFFEYPLYYAYFLLPAGVLIGYLNQTVEPPPRTIAVPKSLSVLVSIMAVTLTALIIHDYLKVEERFAELRFELNKVGKAVGAPPSDLLVLTQWQPLFVSAREKPRPGMSEEDLGLLRAIAMTHPSELTLRQLVYAYGLNGRMDEARYWVDRLCLFSSPSRCARTKEEWLKSLGAEKYEAQKKHRAISSGPSVNMGTPTR